jgi:frataxin-like iron-binding protein CyaY
MSSPLHNPEPESEPPQNQDQPNQLPEEHEPRQTGQTGSIVIGKGSESRRLWLGGHSKTSNPYGFRIYRTVYGDDKNWDRFMSYFKANVEQTLKNDKESADNLSQVDYTVQSGADLDGATVDQVRE